MGMRDCKSKSEIEKEKCPLARELLRGLAICADPKLASSVAPVSYTHLWDAAMSIVEHCRQSLRERGVPFNENTQFGVCLRT